MYSGGDDSGGGLGEDGWGFQRGRKEGERGNLKKRG